MHRGGGAVGSGIAHIDHRDQFVAVGPGEDSSQPGGVEGADPKSREAFVLRREHQVGGDDGGIDLGAVFSVVAADPGVGGATADDQEQWGAVVGARDALDGLQRVGTGDGPDMDRLLVHGRGRDPPGFQDPVDLLLLDSPRRERPAGIPVLYDVIEFHMPRTTPVQRMLEKLLESDPVAVI